MRAVKRASASVKGIGHVLRSPPKPKGARRRESGQRRARHSDRTGRAHGQRENDTRDVAATRAKTGGKRGPLHPGPRCRVGGGGGGGGGGRGARQYMMEGRPRPRKA